MFWTGDNSAHNIWSNSDEEVAKYNSIVTDTIKESLRGKDLPVYPCLGNHDVWPVNIEDFTDEGQNFQINEIKDAWAQWIGNEAAEQFNKWGYFSTDFKLPGGKTLAGSKVIALNTQVANNLNWYLPGFSNDPADHISWLEKELTQIEKAGGFAYIIGHIMPREYIEVFGGRYHVLMERFQHVIRFSMFGHTHNQYYGVIRSRTNTNKMIGIQQVGPSVTTLKNKNPGFVVVEIDEATMLPLNFQIYAFDLEKANQVGIADW